MIVYGDHARVTDPAERRREVAAMLETVATMPPGLGRHSALVDAFVALGMLAQGVLDRDFGKAGEDRETIEGRALIAALTALARQVLASWHNDFETPLPLPTLPSLAAGQIEERLPEGYAFYALYPEAIAVAARQLRFHGAPRVIGLRSIGTGLSAIAAAALDASDPITLRPVGHPFHREVRPSSALAARLLDGVAHYVVVDEGPGLSGSSFAAVAGWLGANGVPGERISFLASNPQGPGHRASGEARRLWATAQHPVVGVRELIPPDRLETWVQSLIGPLARSLEDLSGGRWRVHLYGSDESGWPAVEAHRERLKYLATGADGGRWLVKFVGLGEEGPRKLALARRLTGWCPEPLGLAHGFLVERWEEGRAIEAGSIATARSVADYLADRVRQLPAPDMPGASPVRLAEMALHNIGEEFGCDRASAWAIRLHSPAATLRPMLIDGRMDEAEWRITPSGLLKCDAVDHHRAHDLIGAQDIAWDVAGALVELELTGDAGDALFARLAGRGVPVERAALAFLLPCYLAFRLGCTRMAARMLGDWPAEVERNNARAEHYAVKLRNLDALFTL